MTTENAGGEDAAAHGGWGGGAGSGDGGRAGGTSSQHPDLAADLRALGESLKDALRSAWTSEERERLQSEIERGLASLGQALGRTFDEGARDLSNRERLRQRMEQVRTRVAGLRDELKGETRDRVRSEIHELLTRLNDEVRRSKDRWTPPSGPRGPRD